MKSREFVRILQKDGWTIKRQTGSHLIFIHPIKKEVLVVPYHEAKEVGRKLCLKILKKAGLL
jgi:predicted RNA binding protein YcfA (HicA-like mRNA interferase family)